MLLNIVKPMVSLFTYLLPLICRSHWNIISREEYKNAYTLRSVKLIDDFAKHVTLTSCHQNNLINGFLILQNLPKEVLHSILRQLVQKLHFSRRRMAAILYLFKMAAMLVGPLGSTLDAFLCTKP